MEACSQNRAVLEVGGAGCRVQGAGLGWIEVGTVSGQLYENGGGGWWGGGGVVLHSACGVLSYV